MLGLPAVHEVAPSRGPYAGVLPRLHRLQDIRPIAGDPGGEIGSPSLTGGGRFSTSSGFCVLIHAMLF
jgi:hypothetical protein